MNYNIKIDSKNQIIKVKVTCLLNQEVRKDILLEIASQLGISYCSKVIIDLTESTFNLAEPMVGAMDLITYMRSIGIKSQVKFALVYSEAEDHRKYFEIVAQSGGYNLKYFKSFKEATEWLDS